MKCVRIITGNDFHTVGSYWAGAPALLTNDCIRGNWRTPTIISIIRREEIKNAPKWKEGGSTAHINNKIARDRDIEKET